MTAFNDSFFFAHAMEIRLLLAIAAIAASFAMIKIATLVGDLARSLRVALANAEGKSGAGQLSAAGVR